MAVNSWYLPKVILYILYILAQAKLKTENSALVRWPDGMHIDDDDLLEALDPCSIMLCQNYDGECSRNIVNDLDKKIIECIIYV